MSIIIGEAKRIIGVTSENEYWVEKKRIIYQGLAKEPGILDLAVLATY